MEVFVLFIIPHSNLSKVWSPDTSFNMLEFTLAGIYNTRVISDYPAYKRQKKFTVVLVHSEMAYVYNSFLLWH